MQKQKKQIIALICALVLILLLIDLVPPVKPWDTQLEFWIGESASLEDFSEHEQHLGLFGAHEFLGRGYRFLNTGNDPHEYPQEFPEEYVSYRISSFPDAMSPYCAVTEVVITDPKVSVYGITTQSTTAQFRKALAFKGFFIQETPGGIQASRGRFSIFLAPGESIRIKAKTTNLFQVVY